MQLRYKWVCGYYAGKIDYYTNENVTVPRHTDDINLAKIYKYRKGAENAVAKIIKDQVLLVNVRLKKFNTLFEDYKHKKVTKHDPIHLKRM